MKNFIALTRLNKPIGIFLLMYPCLWGLWLASAGKPGWPIFLVFFFGTIFMRSAGCIVNDFADRHVDGFVERTRMRPLVNGQVSLRQAFLWFCILSLLSFAMVCTLNGYAILLSFVGMGMAIAYPFLKRVTHLPQLGLGFAFSWGLPMAFAAELNTIPPSAWILYLTAIIWTLVYDTMYAMTDRKDDLKIGLKSTAILFGDKDILILGILQIIFFLGLIFSGYLFHLKPIYYLGIFVAAGLAIYQQILIRNREPGACFKAFLNNHYLGFSIFLGIVLSELS